MELKRNFFLHLPFIPQPPPKLVSHAHLTSCKFCYLKSNGFGKTDFAFGTNAFYLFILLSPFSLNDCQSRGICRTWFCLLIKKQRTTPSFDPSLACFVFPWHFCLMLLCSLFLKSSPNSFFILSRFEYGSQMYHLMS